MKRISDLINELEQFKEQYGDIECVDLTFDTVKFSPASHVVRKMKDCTTEESSIYFIPEDEDIMMEFEVEMEEYESYEIITKLYI